MAGADSNDAFAFGIQIPVCDFQCQSGQSGSRSRFHPDALQLSQFFLHIQDLLVRGSDDLPAGFFRSQLARSLKIRRVPELHFLWDDSIERGSRLVELIDKVASENSEQNAG